MQKFRVFNDVSKVRTEFPFLGVRFGMISMTVIVLTTAITAGVALLLYSFFPNPILLAVEAVIGVSIIVATIFIAAMVYLGNPSLSEITKMRLLWRASKQSYITNFEE